MFYSRSTLSEIEDLKDPSKLFGILTEQHYRGDYPYWRDIWSGIKYFNRHKELLESVYFYDDKKLKELEKLGLDYNYRDAAGENFYQYAMGSSKYRDSESNEPCFLGKALDYIISKTDDVCKPNKFNRNVLFYMMSYSAAGLEGKDFFKLIKDYPALDIHLVDKNGKNLIFEALLRNAPFPVVDYFFKNGVSLTQVDNDGHNLLHMFISQGKNKENLTIFNTIFESVEDISQKSRYGDSLIENFLTWSVDDDVHYQERERYNYWLQKSLNKIINGEFKKTEQCLKNMIDILKEHSDSYKRRSEDKDALTYERVLKSLEYFLLDMTMNENKNSQPGKKLKI